MSGGGARAAYQVGMLRWLAQHHPDLHVPILTGVSAGAINAAFLASRLESFRFRVDSASLARNALRLGLKLVSGGSAAAPRAHAAVDTRPLWSLLGRVLDAR